MKRKGSLFEYKEERDKDLISVYRSVISNSSSDISLLEILERTVNSPSKRFWVSTERARNVITEIRAGNKLLSMNKNKRLMFLEIEKRVSDLQKEERYKSHNIQHIISIVLEQEAPCFYMTPESAKVIIHYIKKKCHKERLKRLPFLR